MSTYYVTKYWATTGLHQVEGTVDGRMLSYHRTGGMNQMDYAHGRDFWATEEDARTHIEALRKKKIVRLKKQIDDLRVLQVQIVVIK